MVNGQSVYGFGSDEFFMKQAIRLAREALCDNEVPVGAVVVHNGRVIGKGYNQREKLKDPTAHAELIAITAAAAERDDWRLNGCSLYVTLEPCVMCAGAICLARIDRVIYGANDPKAGAVESLYHILSDDRLNHRPKVLGGILAEETGSILTEFFRNQRKMGKK